MLKQFVNSRNRVKKKSWLNVLLFKLFFNIFFVNIIKIFLVNNFFFFDEPMSTDS